MDPPIRHVIFIHTALLFSDNDNVDVWTCGRVPLHRLWWLEDYIIAIMMKEPVCYLRRDDLTSCVELKVGYLRVIKALALTVQVCLDSRKGLFDGVHVRWIWWKIPGWWRMQLKETYHNYGQAQWSHPSGEFLHYPLRGCYVVQEMGCTWVTSKNEYRLCN